MEPWRKVASMTSGGKPNFFVRYSTMQYPYAARESVCWDRIVRAWAAKRNDKLIGYYTTSQQAKKALTSKVAGL